MRRVLILGGTREAVQLAGQLAPLSEVEVITSLAGRVRQPRSPAGEMRIGGFGGVEGLTAYMQTQHVDLLIDATHPFATHISLHAVAAAQACALPHLMLVRPPWTPGVHDRWLAVASLAEAAALLPEVTRRVFLSIGRLELTAFAHLTDLWFLMRMIDPPGTGTPRPPGTLLLDRGPFALAAERALLHKYAIGAIVSKNSGGESTYAKIVAARELALPVVMIQRPVLPAGELVTTVEAACAWVHTHLTAT